MSLGTIRARSPGDDDLVKILAPVGKVSRSIMRTPLSLTELRRGLIVSFEWPSTQTGDFAKSRHLRPIGKVVTKDDLPHIGGVALGLQLLDDPTWVIDPARAIESGRLYFAEN